MKTKFSASIIKNAGEVYMSLHISYRESHRREGMSVFCADVCIPNDFAILLLDMYPAEMQSVHLMPHR
jgi:hypothetical protein